MGIDKNTLERWWSELEERKARLQANIKSDRDELDRITARIEHIRRLCLTFDDNQPLPSTLNGVDHGGDGDRLRSSHSSDARESIFQRFAENQSKRGWDNWQKMPGRERLYKVHREGKTALIWRKESEYSPGSDDYWFGIPAKKLQDREQIDGGVLLLMPGFPNDSEYIFLPFHVLAPLLRQVRPSKTGTAQFHLKNQNGKVLMMPSGAGEWLDITSHSNHALT